MPFVLLLLLCFPVMLLIAAFGTDVSIDNVRRCPVENGYWLADIIYERRPSFLVPVFKLFNLPIAWKKEIRGSGLHYRWMPEMESLTVDGDDWWISTSMDSMIGDILAQERYDEVLAKKNM
jgi:hypothetical protein